MAHMTKDQIKALLKRRADKVWQNANGTFSHHKDAEREWADEAACRTDLRFHSEWAA